MKVALIGRGAIARFVMAAIAEREHEVAAILVRPGRIAPASPLEVSAVADLPDDLDIVLECAGHSALAAYGPALLRRGFDLISVSIGALADNEISTALEQAAMAGAAKLHLASGAIGALDCLSAARVGALSSVTYTGRKPPQGWKGSSAEVIVNLDTLTTGAVTHFSGTAREAALQYPKNANVAAAVALAGVGFDRTRVDLIADSGITQNIHEVSAQGAFGTFQFQIAGNALHDNPRSSALAAMSMVNKLDQLTGAVVL